MIAAPSTVSSARRELFDRYASVLTTNYDLSRSLVSFQGNRDARYASWFKYREGFSTSLIDYTIETLDRVPGVLLDPFAGAGSALFAAAAHGWQAAGIELLPVGVLAMQARQAAERIQPENFARAVRAMLAGDFATHYDERHAFAHIAITAGAFPQDTEREMTGYLALCERQDAPVDVKLLLRFACFCVLESISYTRKDGQYLRWDHRSGRVRGAKQFDKGRILAFREAITGKLAEMTRDLEGVTSGTQYALIPPAERPTTAVAEFIEVRQASCLEALPQLPAESVDLVITSPPYCNRYDYTRTYALELAFLGSNEVQVKQLRQAMLSCTVENKDKAAQLRGLYTPEVFARVAQVFAGADALQEVLTILDAHQAAGAINNPSIPRMVRNYFFEMCFVIHEMARLLRPGGQIVMVNDNVQYVGEEVPVDLILSHFAECFGLTVRTIWVLPTGKGNSSQQMGKHGRTEIRKCIYIWEKH